MPDAEAGLLAERALSLPADQARLTELVDAVEAFGIACDGGDPEAWLAFITAVAEIGANILVYAYEGRAPGPVELSLRCYGDRVEAWFRDWGAPFKESSAAPAPADLDLDALDSILGLDEGGRGLPLARAALSSVDYERAAGENRWRLVKRLAATERETA
jgi:anti-sigma regulatory factor (Ser/Thr protein kinase)